MKKKYKLPEKPEVQALIRIMDHYIKSGIVPNEREFGRLIGEKNENGLTDIKAGRKKMSLRIIQHLKKSDNRINVNAFVNPEEPIIIEEGSVKLVADNDYIIDLVKKVKELNSETRHTIKNLNMLIAKQEDEIEKLKQERDRNYSDRS